MKENYPLAIGFSGRRSVTTEKKPASTHIFWLGNKCLLCLEETPHSKGLPS